MPHIIAWCGFLGAWLLVAGPLDQAVREVEEVDFEQDAIAEAASKVAGPAQVSSWWLLLPPVWYLRRRQRESEYRHRVAEAMRGEDLAALFTFRDVIGAWAYVAAGAALIAVKETWELHEAYEWPEWVFFALIVVMAVLCVASTRSRLLRRKRLPAAD